MHLFLEAMHVLIASVRQEKATGAARPSDELVQAWGEWLDWADEIEAQDRWHELTDRELRDAMRTLSQFVGGILSKDGERKH